MESPALKGQYTVLLPENGYLRPYELYIRNDIAKVHALDGCFIELWKVFPE